MSRSTKYLPDGRPVRVHADAVVACWREHSTRIDARYATGTAQHETDYALNEKDTEPSGFITMGIFQLSDEECVEAKLATANIYTLEGACMVLATIAEKRLDAILKASGLSELECLPQGVRAYLAIAHNEGLGACLKTIHTYGLDWKAWVVRNHVKLPEMVAYGNDCISGGSGWLPEFDEVTVPGGGPLVS